MSVVVSRSEELAQSLSEALSYGNQEESQRLAQQLAAIGVPVCVRIHPEAFPQNQIRLKVGVEDAMQDSSIPVTLKVTADMTLSELKEKVNKDFGFHPLLQTWVIGKRLARDHETLYSHGVRKDGDLAYLYIRSAHKVQLSQEQQKQEEENSRLDGKNLPNLQAVALLSTATDVGLWVTMFVLLQVGWSCPQCTFVNKPTRPGCEMCGAERPADYQVPEDYEADADEVRRLQQEAVACLQYQQALEDERQKNFRSLIETDGHNLVPNQEVIDCPVCYSTIVPGEGVTLRECLHNFCKECLKGTINNSMDAEVACPYMDDDYACNCKLQDREIKALLSQEEYAKFLELRLSIAETRSENSYHCKTLDCPGWCIFEDEVNEFECQLCKETNCLLCKAIHKNMNCKEYQDDLRVRAENDTAAKQTTEMLNTMLQTGEAMHCPKCQIIVQKKDGCDWMCCVMCKTEICWVTRQARWGPKARDTSGGCKCRVNGILCHPNCQNCH
ncbi:ranBP-type and C3HC4-type zinc finger-containing protein 1 isoform X1 [Arapaima gigas]